MLNIIQSTAAYERWLGGIVEPVAEDTRLKHEVMRKDAFTFFRATFYCWARLWQRLPEPIAAAPSVLGIGDCHVENFGTWRDREGRLIWGVNDFDEAALLPYTNDLLRLAVSALLARERGRLRTTPHNILAALSLGYAAGLEHGGSPFVIEERNSWLRQLAQRNLRAPDQYWAKLNALEPWPDPVPTTAAKFLHDVPRRAELIKVIHRVSGAGSLGRPRLAALFTWRGGYLAREVKALVPSAWVWARLGATATPKSVLPRVWRRAVRCHDPFLKVGHHWIARRLAPDCSRIDLSQLPSRKQETALLRAMGWEIANVHCGSPNVGVVRQHLTELPDHWLADASDLMTSAIRDQFRIWRR